MVSLINWFVVYSPAAESREIHEAIIQNGLATQPLNQATEPCRSRLLPCSTDEKSTDRPEH